MDSSPAAELYETRNPQQTIRRAVRLSGVALHKGTPSEIEISPAPEDYGIRFCRDAMSADTPKSVFDYRSNYTTSIISGDNTFLCVEHVMSCLHGMGISNAHVRFLEGDEFPILDGSAKAIAEAFNDAGLHEQSKPALGVRITRLVVDHEEKGKREIVAKPNPGFVVRAAISFPAPIGHQDFTTEITPHKYASEIQDARTFLQNSLDAIPADDVRKNRLPGLADPIQIVSYNNREFLTPLRYPDEQVRHKILDFVGDIFTVGYPIAGHFSITRPGHQFTLQFAEKLRNGLGAIAA